MPTQPQIGSFLVIVALLLTTPLARTESVEACSKLLPKTLIYPLSPSHSRRKGIDDSFIPQGGVLSNERVWLLSPYSLDRRIRLVKGNVDGYYAGHIRVDPAEGPEPFRFYPKTEESIYLNIFYHANSFLDYLEDLGLHMGRPVMIYIDLKAPFSAAEAHFKYNKNLFDFVRLLAPHKSAERLNLVKNPDFVNDSTVLYHEIAHLVIRRSLSRVSRQAADLLHESIDESLADYFAVAFANRVSGDAVIGRHASGDPRGFRDLAQRPRTVDLESPHSVGHVHSSNLWARRQALIAEGQNPHEIDAAVAQALLLYAQTYREQYDVSILQRIHDAMGGGTPN